MTHELQKTLSPQLPSSQSARQPKPAKLARFAFVSQSAVLLGAFLILSSLCMACGKYGPPVRSQPANKAPAAKVQPQNPVEVPDTSDASETPPTSGSSEAPPASAPEAAQSGSHAL